MFANSAFFMSEIYSHRKIGKSSVIIFIPARRYASAVLMFVCPSTRHKSVFNRNDCVDQARFSAELHFIGRNLRISEN